MKCQDREDEEVQERQHVKDADHNDVKEKDQAHVKNPYRPVYDTPNNTPVNSVQLQRTLVRYWDPAMDNMPAIELEEGPKLEYQKIMHELLRRTKHIRQKLDKNRHHEEKRKHIQTLSTDEDFDSFDRVLDRLKRNIHSSFDRKLYDSLDSLFCERIMDVYRQLNTQSKHLKREHVRVSKHVVSPLAEKDSAHIHDSDESKMQHSICEEKKLTRTWTKEVPLFCQSTNSPVVMMLRHDSDDDSVHEERSEMYDTMCSSMNRSTTTSETEIQAISATLQHYANTLQSSYQYVFVHEIKHSKSKTH